MEGAADMTLAESNEMCDVPGDGLEATARRPTGNASDVENKGGSRSLMGCSLVKERNECRTKLGAMSSSCVSGQQGWVSGVGEGPDDGPQWNADRVECEGTERRAMSATLGDDGETLEATLTTGEHAVRRKRQAQNVEERWPAGDVLRNGCAREGLRPVKSRFHKTGRSRSRSRVGAGEWTEDACAWADGKPRGAKGGCVLKGKISLCTGCAMGWIREL
ncbi:hypothetical protein F5X68DRAFT_214230 [Plectosphaerella plurivora]|uniref:Uncharacterized protein n=1 Tax=Plectosphaerella plurivora TaxID=936078 RepID=A0A9P9A795_9PEZI|nr:hypothetical protein F5X68DRAFT_214230 [Plectosphaerella plurivora]